MAISQQKMLQFLRSNVYANKEAAKTALEGLTKTNFEGTSADGTPIVVRYKAPVEGGEPVVKSMLGIIYDKADGFHVTIFDNADNADAELQEVKDALGIDGVDGDAEVADALSGTTYAKDGADGEGNETIIDAIKALDAAIVANDVYSADKTVVITPMADGAGTDLSVNVDGLTVVKSTTDGKISTAVKIQYVAAKDGVAAHIALMDNANKELSTVEVSDLISNGVLDHSSYDASTGMLSLFFKQADGTLKEEKIDLHEMLDINDMMIATDSTNYLNVVLDGDASESGKSQAVFSALIKTMAETSYAEGSVVTGLVDAADVKKYVDDKATDLAVTAEGDDYVSASVDADDDNKHVIVATNVKDVTFTEGSKEFEAKDGEVIESGDAPSIAGVADSLMDGAQATEAMKDYVDAMVADEAARTDAEIEALKQRIADANTVEDGSYILSSNTVAENFEVLDENLAALSAKTFTDIVGAEGISASTAATTAGTVEVTVKVDALLEAEAVAEKNHANVAGLVLTEADEDEDKKLDVSFDFGEFTL